MRLKLIITFIITLSNSILFAQNNFDIGMDFYQQRAHNAVDFIAPSQNINKALYHFERALNENNAEKAAEMYMKATYFKSAYCYPEGDKRRKEILKNGKAFGKNMVDRFPKSAKVNYWYAVMIGAWAKESSVVSAAKEGVIDKLKEQCELVIKLDPSYDDGAGYRFLAILHLDAPYIPFFLSWPDDEESIELFEKSLKYNPNHISGQYYYAKALNEIGEKEKAISVLKKVVKQQPNSERLLEEQSELDLCKSLLRDLTS